LRPCDGRVRWYVAHRPLGGRADDLSRMFAKLERQERRLV
jgi:hypothetical protein